MMTQQHLSGSACMHYCRRAILLFSVASGMPLVNLAQTAVPAVPLTGENHHHLVYSSTRVRAFDVEIFPNDTTLVHQHDADYIWVGLGEAKIVNLPVGKPAVHLLSKDAALHFARGGFAHKAHNEGQTAYRNVTIELLQKQTGARNLCEQVLAEEPVLCAPASADFFRARKGVTLQGQFETDQIRFDLLQIDPAEALKITGSKNPPLLIALDKTQALATVEGQATQALRDGDVLAPSEDSPMNIRNTGKTAARFLVFEFKQPAP
jgi:hypothetical protein